MPLFCRHNRFTAECPICSRGTVLDTSPTRARTRAPAARRTGATRPGPASAAPAYRGPYASVGPYEDGAGSYEVRLERVPGGLRLAEWDAGAIRRSAPVLAVADLPGLIARGAEGGALGDDAEQLLTALAGGARAGAGDGFGASAGRAGELRDELRIERLDEDRLRVARWILRPNRGWELQQTPVMLPAARYVEALSAAAAAGVLSSG